MKLNQEKINAYYKEIWVTLTKKGELVPDLLTWHTPPQYQPTETERQQIITEQIGEKLDQAYIERRKIEIEINRESKNLKQFDEKIQKYIEQELQDFLKKYPKYKDILSEE